MFKVYHKETWQRRPTGRPLDLRCRAVKGGSSASLEDRPWQRQTQTERESEREGRRLKQREREREREREWWLRPSHIINYVWLTNLKTSILL